MTNHDQVYGSVNQKAYTNGPVSNALLEGIEGLGDLRHRQDQHIPQEDDGDAVERHHERLHIAPLHDHVCNQESRASDQVDAEHCATSGGNPGWHFEGLERRKVGLDVSEEVKDAEVRLGNRQNLYHMYMERNAYCDFCLPSADR